MHVISRKALLDFPAIHSAAHEPLDRWYRIAKAAGWANFSELRADFGSADLIGEYVVFIIGGNKYRLACYIDYDGQTAFIRGVMTHPEYDMERWI